ncbi:MAG: hypothetical protein AAF433_00730 [Bacteroidota bacterium]
MLQDKESSLNGKSRYDLVQFLYFVEQNFAMSAGELPESPQEEPPRSKKRWYFDPQVITAIALTIISVCALLVSLQQTKILAEQQRVTTEAAKAQLWPHLEVDISTGFDDEGIIILRLSVTNSGTGPAIVDRVRLSFRDSVYSDWWDFLRDIPMEDEVSYGITNAGISGRVIQAGESYNALVLDDNIPLMRGLYRYLVRSGEHPKIDVCYHSVFDDHWLLKVDLLGERSTEKVDACMIPPEEQFNG